MARNYPQLLNPTGNELVPTYSQQQDTPLWLTLSGFLTYFQANFVSPTFVKTISTPGDGFNIVATQDTKNHWNLLRPTGALATGTLVLPAPAVAADGQEELVTTTYQIASFTVDGNGATAVYGAPSVIGAENSFKLKYELQTKSWYKVA